MQHVVPSASRTTVLGKYLLAFTRSHSRESGAPRANGKPIIPSPERACLHVLYILHDLFHECKYHNESPSLISNTAASLEPFLLDVFRAASSGQQRRTRRRLEDLLLIWKETSFYSEDFLKKLLETVTNSNTLAPENKAQTNDTETIEDRNSKKSVKEGPYIMPATHGDPSTLCYDLPAGNLMPHIVPNSTVPIRADAVRPLQFLAGPADEALVNAVKDFLRDVEKIDNPSMPQDEDEGLMADIDALGQRVVRLETGEVDLNLSDTYYGWSRAFCEKIKKRHGRKDTEIERRRSYSSSRSRSSSPRKRRRFSDDSYSSRSDFYRRSRSRERTRFRNGNAKRGRTDYSSSRSRSASYSPPTRSPPHGSKDPASATPQHQPPPSVPYNLPGNGAPFPAFPLGPGGLPIPPPRPPGYKGPWPPPPPPLPPHQAMNFSLPPSGRLTQPPSTLTGRSNSNTPDPGGLQEPGRSSNKRRNEFYHD